MIAWNLKVLSEDECAALSEYERQNFCHRRDGKIYFYPDPERHVNRSEDPNVVPDFTLNANIALRDIERGQELSIPLHFNEDF